MGWLHLVAAEVGMADVVSLLPSPVIPFSYLP
jgi:hypothetical protein